MLKSQPRTGHTREPDPTHNELKHTITRKTAAHERNQTHLTFTRVIVPSCRVCRATTCGMRTLETVCVKKVFDEMILGGFFLL